MSKATAEILNLARGRLAILQRTQDLWFELRMTSWNRLAGMSRIVVTGARTVANLVSQQLMDKGGVPLIPPALARTAQVVWAEIRSLPINTGLAAAQVTAAMVTVRAALQSAVRAGAGSALAKFFAGVKEIIQRIGSRVPAIPIIIVIPPGTLEPPGRGRRPDIA